MTIRWEIGREKACVYMPGVLCLGYFFDGLGHIPSAISARALLGCVLPGSFYAFALFSSDKDS